MKISAKLAEKQFVHIATELTRIFPDIDLRFNMTSGSRYLRCLVPEYSEETMEIVLGIDKPQTLIHQAVLDIKAIARLFDA